MALQNPTFVQDPKMTDCIETCNETREAALRTFAWATSGGFENTTPEFLRLLADVADICQTTSGFMLRGSELHHVTCGACAEVCEAAVEACEQSGVDEIEDLKDQLRSCVEHCRDMSSAGGRKVSEGNFGTKSQSRERRTEQNARKGRARSATTKGAR